MRPLRRGAGHPDPGRLRDRDSARGQRRLIRGDGATDRLAISFERRGAGSGPGGFDRRRFRSRDRDPGVWRERKPSRDARLRPGRADRSRARDRGRQRPRRLAARGSRNQPDERNQAEQLGDESH